MITVTDFWFGFGLYIILYYELNCCIHIALFCVIYVYRRSVLYNERDM